jgi:hypothetical protein
MYSLLNSSHVPPMISNIRPVPVGPNPRAPSMDDFAEISEPLIDDGYVPINEPTRPLPMPRVLH